MALTVTNAAAEAARVIERIPPYPGGYEGRGIVICAGGIKYFTCAWVLVNILRRLGCTLPIEVWYLGEDEGDLEWIKLVEPLGVTCVDALEVAKCHPHLRLTGWESKPYAILHSRFKEVLFLDADNVPVVDPTFLFDTPQYAETGAVFWPDGFRTPADSPRWGIFGVPFRDEPEQESGQLIVDKDRCWAALNLCDWYNRNSDFFYEHVYGDKDTFRLAWHRVGSGYAMPSREPEVLPFTLCQHDFDQRRLFQHRIHDKWSLVGNHTIADFVHEPQCRAYVRELREQWAPFAKSGKSMHAEDQELRDRLLGEKFLLELVGRNSWPISLGRFGYLESGAGPSAAFWRCEDGQLVLGKSNGRPLCRLTFDQGQWSGAMLNTPRRSARLIPLEKTFPHSTTELRDAV